MVLSAGTRLGPYEILERARRQYIDIRNRNPKPFVWTKTADEILASIERFCQRTPESGH